MMKTTQLPLPFNALFGLNLPLKPIRRYRSTSTAESKLILSRAEGLLPTEVLLHFHKPVFW